jgi:DNA-binding CsgD family transcriptional regulator
VTTRRGEAEGSQTTGPFRLTLREIECLEWLGRGLRVEGIGSKLGIASTTVVTHLGGARKKLRAATREQALVLALRDGLIDP